MSEPPVPIDKLIVVYRAQAGQHAYQVLRVLRSNGLSPRVLDKGDPDPVLRYAMRHGRYTVPIAVPLEQAEPAAAALIAWEHEHDSQATYYARAARKPLLLIAAILVVAAVLLRLAWGTWEDCPWQIVIVGGLVGLIFFASVRQLIRSAREFPPGHCCTCGYNLRGNVSGRCPECGTAVPPRRRRFRRR